jgi:hypothetical protein
MTKKFPRRALKRFGIVLAIAVALPFLITAPILLFSLLLVIVTWPGTPPGDEEMISHFIANRPIFESLVEKLRNEGGGTPPFCRLSNEISWSTEITASMKSAEIIQVDYCHPFAAIHLYYKFDPLERMAKYYTYYPADRKEMPPVIDLHGDDAADRGRAALCDPKRRADLKSLCDLTPRVNDLDVLLCYDRGKGWDAERPIDGHWALSLRVLH